MALSDSVAVVLPKLAVESIGAAVDRHIDHGAGSAAELRAVVIGFYVELIDGVGDGGMA